MYFTINQGTNGSDEIAERVDIKEPPCLPPADGDASPGDGGTWEDVAEEENDPIITPEGDDDEPSSEEAPKIIKKKPTKIEEVAKNKKEHVNVVFIGHVDAGKSTIGGQIMALTGMVDKRTLDKYEREAREKSRESWYLSWALDTNQEGIVLRKLFPNVNL